MTQDRGDVGNGESDPSALILVLELGHRKAVENARSREYSDFTDAIVTFVNAHCMLNRENRVCLIGCGGDGSSSFLYSPSNSREELRVFVKRVGENIVRLVHKKSSDGKRSLAAKEGYTASGLSSALSKALCYANRLSRESKIVSSKKNEGSAVEVAKQQRGDEDSESNPSTLSSRIVVVSTAKDDPKDYVSTMNCIFAAERMSIPIDACVIGGGGVLHRANDGDGGVLQQAAHMTKGLYQKVDQAQKLLQYLLSVFLVSPRLRKNLLMPKIERIDYSAACSCCTPPKMSKQGYVCAVCLSIFCERPDDKCLVCGVCVALRSSGIAGGGGKTDGAE